MEIRRGHAALTAASTPATFTLYTFAPLLYRKASTACYNLSLLFADFYGLLFRLSLYVRRSPRLFLGARR